MTLNGQRGVATKRKHVELNPRGAMIHRELSTDTANLSLNNRTRIPLSKQMTAIADQYLRSQCWYTDIQRTLGAMKTLVIQHSNMFISSRRINKRTIQASDPNREVNRSLFTEGTATQSFATATTAIWQLAERSQQCSTLKKTHQPSSTERRINLQGCWWTLLYYHWINRQAGT